MKIPLVALRLPVLVFCLGSLKVSSATEEVRPGDNAQPITQDLGKRLYDFGLGKRAYRYSNEFKRLPMYDFGLGKRAKAYSFGLGKRADEEEDRLDYYLDDGDQIPETEIYDDEQMQVPEKRKQAYAFGLGKRPRYEFGLGKRSQKQYSFGLGKRERLFSFGLGKRSVTYPSGIDKPKVYHFALGKHGEPEYSMEKREVSPNELKAVLHDSSEEENNNTAVVDSHEVMGHGDRQKIVQKRSLRQYSFGLGKRQSEDETYSPTFSRQYRKPSYSFGLGKRRVADSYDQDFQL